MTSKLRAPKVCPVCGKDVPRTALACPECGADHTSGWREDAEAYDAVDLPDEDFNYEKFVKEEFGSSRRPAIKRVWWITAILLEANRPRAGQSDGSDNLSAITVAIFMLVLSLLCGTSICDADGFDSVHCGADVQKALLGSTMTNEKVSVIEGRHTDLGLKDLGGTEISDRLFLISWRICGEEYALLEDQGVVRDVLKFPKHSKDSPQFIGSCQLNGHDVPGTAIGVPKNENGVEILPAVTAWKIDDKQTKFVKLQTEGLRCSRDGIITADGGL